MAKVIVKKDGTIVIHLNTPESDELKKKLKP